MVLEVVEVLAVVDGVGGGGGVGGGRLVVGGGGGGLVVRCSGPDVRSGDVCKGERQNRRQRIDGEEIAMALSLQGSQPLFPLCGYQKHHALLRACVCVCVCVCARASYQDHSSDGWISHDTASWERFHLHTHTASPGVFAAFKHMSVCLSVCFFFSCNVCVCV